MRASAAYRREAVRTLIRGGADVFKALALGASAVGIGRPYAYGLALDGEAGVGEVLDNLAADFELTMALAGCSDVAAIRAGATRLVRDEHAGG